MSGPQGSDPHQPWQQPGQAADHSADPTMLGAPWQQGQQPPAQDATWHAPAYTPSEYPQYQQPGAQQYPATPGYGSDFGSQPTQIGATPPQYQPPGQYQQPGQYGQPAQYGQPPQAGQYGAPGQPGQYPQQYPPYAQPAKKRPTALIAGIGGGFALLLIVLVLVLGFWQPGFFVTTKLDVNKAQSGVQQILTDETNGYGAKNVKDVKCNGGSDPTVKKGASFDCTVNIDGASKKVTVTFQDGKGTYEVGRPQ